MWPTVFHLPFIDYPIRGYGLMLMIGFLGGTWWAARRAARVKADPDMMVNLGFVALITSVIGARIFYVVHYWDEHFAGRGLRAIVDITAGGLEFYGGLIGALLAFVAFVKWRKLSLRLYLDIAAPSLMFGMGMARIGCFLNGCCWGSLCPPDMAWSVRFPFASPALARQWEERQVTLPDELLRYHDDLMIAYPLPRDVVDGARRDFARNEADSSSVNVVKAVARQHGVKVEDLMADATSNEFRSRHVHPAQLYSSMDGILLAILLNAYFYRRKRHGMVFVALLLLYPAARIVEEIIRSDNPHDALGLTISQFVSVLLLLLGASLWVVYRRLPLRSPRAVPYVPPWEEEERLKAEKKQKRRR